MGTLVNPNNKTFLEGLRLSTSFSFGIFLFILFFQPFALDRLDYNNRLLFVAGFGGIVFLLSLLMLFIIIYIFRVDYQFQNSRIGFTYIIGLIIFILSSVAFSFYIRYVGHVEVTFYIVFKVILICISPLVVFRIYEIQQERVSQNEQLIADVRILQKKLERIEDENLNKTIEFVSDNTSENLVLQLSEIAFIKSADNYVEVYYSEEGETLKKRLIRNTLKNIESQLSPYTNFIRCHRVCIVNKSYIEELSKSYNNYWLTLKGYKEQIPVSRQYLLKVKEAI